MEKKIKALYILSIATILAFLGMQAYWLYGRYAYSLTEYESRMENAVAEALKDYDAARHKGSATEGDTVKVQSKFQMSHGVDSVGKQSRKVTVTTKIINGRKLLGINEHRNLTPEEMNQLQHLVIDSLEMVDANKASIDASTAPSDGVAWNAMMNFESEIQTPFTVEGIDSMLRKHNINAEVSLIIQDSVTWEPVIRRHSSVFAPAFKVTTPYSELERKAVVIECKIPSSDVLRYMGWTFTVAVILSILLILCLVWQTKTIVKLSRLDKMRNSFITTMIHELKRPISTLKLCVSGLDNSKLMEDTRLRHELSGEIRMALDNLSAYFSRLRDITFNNIEQIPLNITSFNLSELVDKVIESFQLPSSKVVVLKNNVPASLEVSADRSHLMNIFTNLIENAIKYSGNEVTVIITAETISEGVKIRVNDNGNGIASGDLHNIFNRFYRGKASATEIPGMGLGLTYVKLLSDAHGGEISVESTEGEGSTFTIMIPQ